MIQSLLQQVQTANSDSLLNASKELAKELKSSQTDFAEIATELNETQKTSVTQQLAIQFANEDIQKSIKLIEDTLASLTNTSTKEAIDLQRYLGTIFIYTKKNEQAAKVFDQLFALTPVEEQDLNFLFGKWATELKYKAQDEVLWQAWQAILDGDIDFDTDSAKDLANKIFTLYKGLPEELHRDHRRFSDHMFMHQNATKFTHLINYLAELDI